MIADWKYPASLLAAILLMGGSGGECLGAEDGIAAAETVGEDAAHATPPPSTAKLDGLLKNLEADDYETRMGAQSELVALASRHASIVAEALVGPYLVATDADLRARLRLTLWNAKRYEINTRPVGFVGIQMLDSFRQNDNQAINGGFQPAVQVVAVIEQTAAAKNDLRIGDLIVGVDGKEFANGESPSILFKEHIGSRTVGEPVELKVIRGALEMTVKLELGERPIELFGMAGEERDAIDTAFNAFLREAAQKRGLAVPGREPTPVVPNSNGTESPDENPFEP